MLWLYDYSPNKADEFRKRHSDISCKPTKEVLMWNNVYSIKHNCFALYNITSNNKVSTNYSHTTNIKSAIVMS